MPQHIIKLKTPKRDKRRLPLKPRVRDSRRVSRYIDSRLQGGLIVAVLLFELLLIVAGLMILHDELHQVVEDQLFRIHPGVQEGMPILVHHLVSAMGVIVLANVSLVIAIEWFWSRHVAKIITPLRAIFDAVRFLDLRHKPEPAVDHDVLNRAGSWVQTEHLRCSRLLRLMEELNPDTDTDKAISLIAEMRQCLPDKPVTNKEQPL
ncbi:MAG: hypothetical protein L3J26_03575 [Candidatus Polarisedimenticolaceae bacterium]|nr:hypothetical protein [Candidatus Polarisedimenticolaceae bacterium]